MHTLAPLGLSVVLVASQIPVQTHAVARLQDISPDTLRAIQDDLEPPSPYLNTVQLGSSRDDQQKSATLNEKIPVRSEGKSLSTDTLQGQAYTIFISTFPPEEWQFFVDIVSSESGWNPKAQNKNSGACGIPQALPCNKLPQGMNTSFRDQIQWTINYIKNRYGTPREAWSFHLQNHWY